MSDDLSQVDWGAAIELTGKRPTWLEDGIPMRWSAGGNPYLDVKSHECVNWGRDYPVSIRLPGDHPYYRQDAEPKGLTTNETLTSDDIAKRMEALVRQIAGAGDIRAMTDEARAIVALLPEPVDADLVEARKVVISMEDRPFYSWNIKAGEHDRDPLVQAALAAIKHTRALERDSREG